MCYLNLTILHLCLQGTKHYMLNTNRKIWGVGDKPTFIVQPSHQVSILTEEPITDVWKVIGSKVAIKLESV